MKTTKRVLAILLVLTLGLALFAPMAAATDPIITGITPQNPVARTNQSITLTVDAQPPEDAEGPLSYQWYQWVDGEWQAIEGATAKSLNVTAKVEEFISEDIVASIQSLMNGLTKQYKLVVSCGEDLASQETSALFLPSFSDAKEGYFQVCTAAAVNFVYGPDTNFTLWLSGLRFVKVFLFPITLLCGSIIWAYTLRTAG